MQHNVNYEHGNFHVPVARKRAKVHGNFHVPLARNVKGDGNFHDP